MAHRRLCSVEFGATPMTIRIFGALLCGTVLVLAMQTNLAQAQSASRSGFWQEGTYGQGLRAKKKKVEATTPALRKTKSSKSNTSDRMGGGGGKGTAKNAGIVLNLPWNAGDKKTAPKPTHGSGRTKVMTSSPNTPVR